MKAPRFSIVTPVYNTNRRHLEQCIASVLAQNFKDWELCLVDDKSPKHHVREVLREAELVDPRIRASFRAENGGIVAASNDGLAMARGEFVALLDHDDVLEPDALQLTHHLLESDSEIDYVYTDETLMTEKGEVIERFHKPDWSPERFRHQMYVCHLSTIRRSLVSEVGGFRSGFDGAQDYDLIFRVTERARKIGHVPHLLYHWRMAESSVANNASAKPYAYDAGKRAIESHLERTGRQVLVEKVDRYPGNYRLRRQVPEARSTEILVPDSGARGTVYGLKREHAEETRAALMTEGLRRGPVRVLTLDDRSTATSFNSGVQDSRAEIVLLTSEALEPATSGWLDTLLEPFNEPTVAVVSGITYSANSRLQHAGYFLHGSFLDKSHFRLSRDNKGQRAVLQTIQEISAVDWQIMAVRREIFAQLGGFNERLAHPWTVVDFCLRASASGYSVLLNPWAEFFEYSDNDDCAHYRIRAPKDFRTKWNDVFRNDPFRPQPSLRDSRDALRPFWWPQRLRDFSSVRRR